MHEPHESAAGRMALAATADLQDHLLMTTHDLERLQALLDDSHKTLQSGFFGVLALLQDLREAGQVAAGPYDAAREHLACAVKALQFQDMATQLISHTSCRLRHCADRLAQDVFADDDDGDAVVQAPPLRPNPVTQSEMDTGFIELF